MKHNIYVLELTCSSKHEHSLDTLKITT